MTFWQEFSTVFTEIGWVSAICLIVGMILIVVEIFQPGFGVFGITGGILVAVGIAVRMYKSGAGNPIIQMVILLGIVALVLGIALIFMVISFKKGWLSKTAFVESSKAVDEGHSLGTADFSDLIGKQGVAECALRPSGSIAIDGKLYDVVTQSSFIEKGASVIVSEIEGVRIVVKPIAKAVAATDNSAVVAQEKE